MEIFPHPQKIAADSAAFSDSKDPRKSVQLLRQELMSGKGLWPHQGAHGTEQGTKPRDFDIRISCGGGELSPLSFPSRSGVRMKIW